MDRGTRVTEHYCKKLDAINAAMRHAIVTICYEDDAWFMVVDCGGECLVEQTIDYCPFCGKKLGEGKT